MIKLLLVVLIGIAFVGSMKGQELVGYMNKLLASALLLILSFNLFGQKPTTKDQKLTSFTHKWEGKDKLIEAWIIGVDGSVNHGFLYDVKDSSLSIKSLRDLKMNNDTKFENKVTNINEIILRESHRKHKHFFMAIGTGLIGAVLGYLTISEDETLYSSSIFKPALGFSIGFVPVLIIGSRKVKVPVNHNIAEFKRSKKRLHSLSVKGNGTK